MQLQMKPAFTAILYLSAFIYWKKFKGLKTSKGIINIPTVLVYAEWESIDTNGTPQWCCQMLIFSDCSIIVTMWVLSSGDRN